MASYGEGKVEIPLEEFWAFTRTYIDQKKANIFCGVPSVNIDNQTLELNYMFNSDINPQEEVGFEQSKCKLQWDELKAKQQ